MTYNAYNVIYLAFPSETNLFCVVYLILSRVRLVYVTTELHYADVVIVHTRHRRCVLPSWTVATTLIERIEEKADTQTQTYVCVPPAVRHGNKIQYVVGEIKATFSLEGFNLFGPLSAVFLLFSTLM